ncbi:MAG TPA: 50S ribosomal protein L4 [Thermodesulfovibrionales bacterium]|nr:50S ribosomal protein L4 [Thermodesulfovibrionales bacterium]
MAEVEIKDKNNKVVGKMNLNDEVFSVKAKEGVVHSSVVNYLANQRQGTHATKTKGLISGGGKKPYKQKHTGRARAGSSRSPLWRGGGTVFGPEPRDYSYKLPKQMKRLAFMKAFQEKLSSGEIVIIDDLNLDKPRTKDIAAILGTLGLDNKSVLIVTPDKNNTIMLSARNIPRVAVTKAADMNTYDICAYGTLLITKDALTKIEEIKGS